MAFQMGIIILVGTLIGRKIDTYFELETPWATVAFALLSIFTALYLTLKDLK
jgi:F0F1-type ATP synthase assembly protein I